MNLKKLLLPLSLSFFAAAPALHSTTVVATDPVGYVSFEIFPEADTVIGVPMAREVVFASTVDSVVGSAVVVAGNPFTADEYLYQQGSQPNTYYIQFTTGAAAGHFATITANTTNSVTIDLEVDTLSDVSVGDAFNIRPYWTIGMLFPDALANVSFIPSTNNLVSGRRTEILIPNIQGSGINRSPQSTLFYNSYWRLVGDVSANQNDLPILPDSYIIVRGNGHVGPLTLVVPGSVRLTPHTSTIIRTSGGRNDNPLTAILPVDTTLNDFALGGPSGPFQSSNNNLQSGRGDELYVFINSGSGKNPSPVATFFYNSFWRQVGNVSVDAGDFVIPAGSAFFIRTSDTGITEAREWTYSLSSN